MFDRKGGEGNEGDQSKDDEAREQIIAFGTEERIRRLQELEIWFLDGTLKTSRLFKQLYTIHYVFQGECFPAVYLFMF